MSCPAWGSFPWLLLCLEIITELVTRYPACTFRLVVVEPLVRIRDGNCLKVICLVARVFAARIDAENRGCTSHVNVSELLQGLPATVWHADRVRGKSMGKEGSRNLQVPGKERRSVMDQLIRMR